MEVRIARRYARALFHKAREAGNLEDVSSELKIIAELFQNDQKVRDVFLTPIGDHRDKERAVESLASTTTDLTRDFLKLLIEKKREDILYDTQREFEQLKREFAGVAKAHIISAVALDDGEKRSVLGQLEKRTGLKVEPTYEIDGKLIGGVKVTIGDDVLMDGSVQGRLAELRERMFRDLLGQA